MKIAPYIMIYNNYNIIAYKDFYSNNKIKKDKKNSEICEFFLLPVKHGFQTAVGRIWYLTRFARTPKCSLDPFPPFRRKIS